MGTRNTPDDAYRFCKGEAIKKLVSGTMVKKSTPYDWCAVTDHAEYLGIMPLIIEKGNAMAKSPIGKDILSGDPKKGADAFQKIMNSVANLEPIPYMSDPKTASTVWEKQKAVANKHNDPGKFTTMIAFEWTSQTMYENMHHNVFFRDDKGPDTIYSSLDSVHREDLWTYQEVQRKSGHENFSIPHNANVSNGLMYAPTTSNGNYINKQWAERSNRNSPATEIIQTKGASETHPALSPNDEFAGFETSYKHLLGSGGVVSRINNGYVRRALTDGQGFQEMIGANPFKYGIVSGATPGKPEKHRANASVNRYLEALGSVLGAVVKQWHWLPQSPMRAVAKLKEARGRTRFLKDDELKRLLAACKKAPTGDVYLAVLLAVTTGARKGNIMGLRWEQIDFERAVFHIPKTKNGDPRMLPIVPEALRLLRERRESSGAVKLQGFVFPSKVSDRQPIRIQTAWRSAFKTGRNF